MRQGVLARYVIRAHLGPFLFALSAITGLIFINAIAQRVDSLVGKGLPWSVIGEFLLLSLPHTIALSLPMSVLVAVLYAFSGMASSNEITAMAAGGVRPARLMAPVFGLGVIAMLVMLFFNDSVLPESNHALKNLLLDIGRKTPTLELREQVVNEITTGTGIERYFLTADRIDHDANRLENVTIFDANDPERQRTTYASSGQMAFNDARTDLYLTLHDGVVHEVQRDREGGFQRLYFREQVVPLRNIGNELERRVGGSDRSDREMSLAMLSENALDREIRLDSIVVESRARSLEAVRVALNRPLETDTAWAEGARRRITTGFADAPYITQDGLTQQVVAGSRARAARGSALAQSMNRYRVEIHKKWAIAVACLVFVLLGPPLALRFPTAGVGFVVVASGVVFFVYWFGLLGGETLADRRVAAPAVSMWITNVIFFLVALVLLARMGHSAGTSRGGGGFGDVVRSFFGTRRAGPGASAP